MKQILLACTFIVLTSGCGDNSCELDADNYRPRECAIKVESQEFKWHWFSISGTNPNNGTRNTYSDLGKWYPLFNKYIAIGDTVIKRKDELVFYVHKKDTVLSFPYECDGKIIK